MAQKNCYIRLRSGEVFYCTQEELDLFDRQLMKNVFVVIPSTTHTTNKSSIESFGIIKKKQKAIGGLEKIYQRSKKNAKNTIWKGITNIPLKDHIKKSKTQKGYVPRHKLEDKSGWRGGVWSHEKYIEDKNNKNMFKEHPTPAIDKERQKDMFKSNGIWYMKRST